MDYVTPVELIQLHQLEYLQVDVFEVDTARAVRYMSVKHQLRSLIILGDKFGTMLPTPSVAHARRALDALALNNWNDMRPKHQVDDLTPNPPDFNQGQLDDRALDDLPPAALTYLDLAASLLSLSAANFLSLCRLTTLRRFRCVCGQIGSLAQLGVVTRFLDQLESFDLIGSPEKQPQAAFERCRQVRQLSFLSDLQGGRMGTIDLARDWLTQLTQLRALTLECGQLVQCSGLRHLVQLEELSIETSESNPTQLLESVASSIALLTQFCSLTFRTDYTSSSLVLHSRTLSFIGESKTWSTLRLGQTRPSQPTMPKHVWNIDASQEQLSESTDTVTDRVEKSFRVHLTRLGHVYRIGTNTKTGKLEWQVDNQ